MIGNIGRTQGVRAIARPKIKNDPNKMIGGIFCNMPVNNPASSLADHKSDKPNFFLFCAADSVSTPSSYKTPLTTDWRPDRVNLNSIGG